MQLLVSIQSKQQLALIQLNQTEDYSFLNASISRLNDANSPIVPRIPESNARLPAYVNNQLVWGSPPMTVRIAHHVASPVGHNPNMSGASR